MKLCKLQKSKQLKLMGAFTNVLFETRNITSLNEFEKYDLVKAFDTIRDSKLNYSGIYFVVEEILATILRFHVLVTVLYKDDPMDRQTDSCLNYYSRPPKLESISSDYVYLQASRTVLQNADLTVIYRALIICHNHRFIQPPNLLMASKPRLNSSTGFFNAIDRNA
ncbi:MAG: hypothetical protein WBE68_16760 [Candidatus Nitrosopolaris sp.]